MAPKTLRKAYIAGVGATAFIKPRNLIDYPELAVEAATKALLDAGINYDDVEQAIAGWVYGDSTAGQRALYALGMTGIPIMNVNNNCSTGSSALWMARQAVASGMADCVMALGFEKMAPGSLAQVFDDRAPPLEKTVEMLNEVVGVSAGPMAAQIFGNGAEEYCQKNGSTWQDVAEIAAKNHTHSAVNPYSQFRNKMTGDQVFNDKKVTNHMTRGMCCPTSDGAACAIVCSEEFIKAHGLENQAIEIAAQAMTTDTPRLFDDRSSIELTGADMTRLGAKKAYAEAGIQPTDIQLIELHDCFAANELLVYDSLGLTAPGKAHELVRNKDNTYGGKYVINPSGGLESKGHPLGATGLGMAFYCCNQLRGWAGPMQDERCVPGYMEKQGKTAYTMAHNLGLGGSCVITIFKRPDFYKQGGKDGRDRLGYNHGCECKSITQAEVEKVRSQKMYSSFAQANLAE